MNCFVCPLFFSPSILDVGSGSKNRSKMAGHVRISAPESFPISRSIVHVNITQLFNGRFHSRIDHLMPNLNQPLIINVLQTQKHQSRPKVRPGCITCKFVWSLALIVSTSSNETRNRRVKCDRPACVRYLLD